MLIILLIISINTLLPDAYMIQNYIDKFEKSEYYTSLCMFLFWVASHVCTHFQDPADTQV